MSKKLTSITNQDREKLRGIGVGSLPDNPSSAGMSAAEVKGHSTRPNDFLLSLLKRLIEEANDAFDGLQDGTFIAEKASKDANGNVIHTTYETKADAASKDALNAHLAGAETITGKKTFTGGAEFSTANVKIGSSGSDNSKSFDIYYTTNLRGPVVSNTIIPGNTFALGSAEHYWGEAFIDDLYLYGSISDGLYEWTLPAKNGTFAMTSEISALESELNAEVEKFKDGTYTADKAAKDGNGNNIASTYETKSDASAKIARSNLVSILKVIGAEGVTDTEGLFSSADKTKLDTLYALLSSDDSDTVVNTIAEVLSIFDQYPEGVTLTNALALKLSIADIVDAYNSTATNRPLSANKGKDLNDRLGVVESDYVTHDDVFSAGMIGISDYDDSTGEITLTYESDVMSINYDSDTGVVTFTY